MFQRERLGEKIAIIVVVLLMLMLLWAAIHHPQWLSDPEGEYRGF
jgi:hypothetical protein